MNVLKHWFNIVSAYKKDAVFMDFFAGTGSSGQAVIEMNDSDSGDREILLMTLNESNIVDEITIPRLSNVLSGEYKKPSLNSPSVAKRGLLSVDREFDETC